VFSSIDLAFKAKRECPKKHSYFTRFVIRLCGRHMPSLEAKVDPFGTSI